MTAALIGLGGDIGQRSLERLQRLIFHQAVDMALLDPAAIDAFGAACAKNLAAHHLDEIGQPRW